MPAYESELRFTDEQRKLLMTLRSKWVDYALCRGDNQFTLDLDGQPKHVREAREKHCRDICKHCPVVLNCLVHSLKFPEESEFWGGRSKRERSRLRVDSRRGIVIHR